MNKFPALMNEIACINRAYGWRGFLDALEYISKNRAEYIGTQCYREFLAFSTSARALFA